MSGVAIVTGGSRGIGRSCCKLLAAAGHPVVVNYVSDKASADALVAEISAAGGKAVTVQGDVAREDDVLAIFAAADALGPLEILINNAGVVDAVSRVEDMSLARLTRMFAINVTGSFLCAREAVKRLSTRHGGTGGSIVNLSSMAAVMGAANQCIDYAAAKGAIDSFTVGLSREVAGEGIRVNAVRPGIIDTDIHASGGLPGRVAEAASLIPMQRAGTADEVAETIVWLASAKAAYITGALVNISGGR